MHKNLTSASLLLVFTFFIFSTQISAQFINSFAPNGALPPLAAVRPANNFVNPLVKISSTGCAAENLRAERFTAELALNERVRLCQSFDKVTSKLNRTAWSPALSAELRNIWQTFSAEPVTLRSMPKNASSRMLAMAEPFPDKTNANIFAAAVYVRVEKSGDESFFHILLHELRHVLDFHETWKNKTALDSLEIERRAYLLMGKLTQETPEKENFSGVPKFWKDSWRKLSETEIALKRGAAVEKYLRSHKLYRDLARDPQRQKLDFSYLKVSTQSNNPLLISEYDKKQGERLPNHKTLPQTASVLAQNIRETDLNLEKPKNPRDAQEILRVALHNEKKLYYGMSNFVYDQKLNFQCFKKGKLSASYNESNTVARTGDGNTLLKLTAAPANLPCVLNYGDLKTDFTNTFWASPALEKMPIQFSGFYEVEGKMLAHYNVLQPNEKLFNELANEYPQIRPFRVVVGTIYVSPEDGQIVRFAGTSFPEENVTGDYAKTAHGTYWVKAVRQKLNVENGLWVTVHVGTVAVANVQGKFYPFNYTVKFENYRQSETDVKILDDETVAENITK